MPNVPPPPSSGAPLPPTPSVSGSVTLLSPPTPVASLPAGTKIEAVVVRSLQPSRHDVLLDTPYGQIKANLPTTLTLAAGTRLVLETTEFRPGQAVMLRIMAVNPVPWLSPKPDTLLGSTPPGLGVNPAAAAVWQTSLPSHIPAQVIAAPDHFFPSHSDRSSAPLPPWPIGTTVLFRLTPIASSNAGAASASSSIHSPAPTSQTGLLTEQGSITQPMPQGTPSAASTPIPGSITGIIAPHTNSGRAIIATPMGLLSMDRPLSLPAGTPVSLDIIQVTPQLAHPDIISSAESMKIGSVSVPSWPGMERALAIALQTNGPDGIKALIHHLPTSDGRMLLALMAFSQLSRPASSTRPWPGESVRDILEQSLGRESARALSAELREMIRPSTDGGGDWRLQNLPFLNGNSIEKITLISRRDGEQDSEKDAVKAKKGERFRFLLNLNLSRLGPMQFDGLYLYKDRRLDLLIRTHIPLDIEIRTTMLALYTNASQALNLVGSLLFHASPSFAGPADAIPGHPDPGPGLIV
ncbi:hypothetical protein HEQ62_00575 [Haematospirillum jordaniae]|uniref:Uncharacterized protein n=1 Tax=Haematospirillum jordaniae TaxID=1549855 RepID=A0A143DFC5_9PROT|nr:hypothetical protein [Haematospirillum jordaniae]AMW35356.1 hypothetical protein AY555_09385 [Haematospirillum jordaniae]NKD45190.1 hypothetical protein [Haematospirillum jordaniae]NKD56224.1 hypothetical protein [Haematospirillum jordaniae]NKD58281.1 hypothetical protein [Haematospirillum jordaniae]NKD66547.1 hypothetical protein [Haematospirillum jordaniae]